MRQISLKMEPLPPDLPAMLQEQGVRVNRYAEQYFSHPRFAEGLSGEITVTVASLREIGLESGGTLAEIFRRLPEAGLKPCPPAAGVFLRLAWRDQPQSRNTILSGTHSAPDRAVTVLSGILEPDDDFPKGLYLRNVDGGLWLRGYVCDASYRFSGEDLFAFQTTEALLPAERLVMQELQKEKRSG